MEAERAKFGINDKQLRSSKISKELTKLFPWMPSLMGKKWKKTGWPTRTIRLPITKFMNSLVKFAYIFLSRIKYSSVSPSFTLSRKEKVGQYIRKKTHKPKTLRFWIEGGVISLYGFDSCFILVGFLRFPHLDSPITVHFIVTLYIMLENIHGPFQEIIKALNMIVHQWQQNFKYDSGKSK